MKSESDLHPTQNFTSVPHNRYANGSPRKKRMLSFAERRFCAFEWYR